MAQNYEPKLFGARDATLIWNFKKKSWLKYRGICPLEYRSLPANPNSPVSTLQEA